MRLVPVDAATDYRRDGRACGSADDLLPGQRQWQGLWVSAPEVEFGYLLAKQALQGASPAQQTPRLQELRQELGDRAGAVARRLFGCRLGERVMQWIAAEDWTALESSLPRLRQAILWQALWHDPLNLLHYWIPEGARPWRRWRYSQRWCSTLRRRGGLLLLVLVCMITGCTGSRTRERATVTVPPAPEKVAVNPVSSSKARLSAPPRNKAKAPVTAVKPAAAPLPAPQQQGEDQEGRVF